MSDSHNGRKDRSCRHEHHARGPAGIHDHSDELRKASKKSLVMAFSLIAGFMFVEVAGGIISGSLALLADAAHMMADAGAIALALAAMYFSGKPYTASRTYGFFRLEILAALANVLTLWVIAAGIIWEAFRRFSEPSEVQGATVIVVGTIGIAVNLAAAWVLHGSARHSVNVAGAFAHVLADLIGSIGVIVSGILILAFGWVFADPAISVIIGAIIVLGTWRLLSRILHVLLEGTPEHVDIYDVCRRMEALEGVTLVHDIHVWTISPGYDALTAHVLVDPDYPGNSESLLRRLRKIASEEFGIRHITIQLEATLQDCTEDHHFDHLLVP